MRPLLTIFFLLASQAISFAQNDRFAGSFFCTNGMTHFFAATPIENIEATSKSTMCVLNTETKKVSSKVQMKSFDFPEKLMQEHFNENYVESEKYPSGILDAIITNDIDFTKDGVYDVLLKGTFEVHGVKQEREIKGKLIIKDGQPYNATAEFDVKLADHNIKIPQAVITKIAEVIKVNVDFTFQKYQKK